MSAEQKEHVVAIRIRGTEGVRYDIKKTLDMLRLSVKHFCTIIRNTPSNIGMLQKAKDYITWGVANQETLKLLYEKRGIQYKGDGDKKNQYITVGNRKLKPFFRLHPPRGGFERKGIKQPFSAGGVLGDRKEKINDLIMRMI
jgi:large subunit ribosomal protein L30